MMEEPRFVLIDKHKGREVKLTTDELQWALWAAQERLKAIGENRPPEKYDKQFVFDH